MHLNLVCSRDITKQIVILKIKVKPVSINAAANCNEQIFYDIMMQCLQPLLFAQYSNVHDRITVLICRRMISCETLLHSFSFHHPYLFFYIYHERNLEWNCYGRLSSILFLKSSIPLWHLPYSIPKFPFHFIPFSIPFQTMPCFLPNVECGKFKLKQAFQSGKILAYSKKSEICATSTVKLIKKMLKCQVAQASSTCMLY